MPGPQTEAVLSRFLPRLTLPGLLLGLVRVKRPSIRIITRTLGLSLRVRVMVLPLSPGEKAGNESE